MERERLIDGCLGAVEVDGAGAGRGVAAKHKRRWCDFLSLEKVLRVLSLIRGEKKFIRNVLHPFDLHFYIRKPCSRGGAAW